MSDENSREIRERIQKKRGGHERDSQGDGVADIEAERADARGDGRDQVQFAQPGTNREAVPDGIEGSIMESEREKRKHQDRANGHSADRPEGNDRRVDEL